MKAFEQMKMFVGTSTAEVEKKYNAWVRKMTKHIEDTPTLSGHSLEIYAREFAIRLYDGEESYGVTVFYKHWDLLPFEKGQHDYGKGVQGVTTTGSGVQVQRPRKG